MAKQKTKHGQSISAPELIRLAEERLAQPDREDAAARALELLRSAEAKLKQATSPAGKKISVPPHLVAARAALPALFARAHFLHARTAPDLQRQIAELREAAARTPEEARYLLACGASRLLAGEMQEAGNDFAQAAARQPGAPLAARAQALGQLAAGQARQAKELLAAVSESDRDANWQRLATLCGLIGGLDAQVAGVHGDFPMLAAMAQLAAGDRAAAAPWFQAPPVLDHNPSQAEAAEIATRAFYAGAIHLEAGRLVEGLAQFRAARDLAGAHRLRLPWLARLPAWCHFAAERAFAENPVLATEYWELARALAPNDKIARANLALARQAGALAAWRAGDLDLCVKLWQETLSTSPDDEQVLRHLALALERLDRKAEALPHWRALARAWRRKAKGRDADPRLRERALSLEEHILQLMIDTGQPPSEIAAEFEAALKADPDNIDLRKRAVEHLLELGRGTQALKHLQQIEQRQGPSAEIAARQAIALASLRRNADAIKAFERARALDPADATARPAFLLFLGSLAEKAEEDESFDLALQYCEQQLNIDPAYLPAIMHLASLYFSLDDEPLGEEYIRRALALAPEEPRIRVRIGAIYLENDRARAATAEFNRALKLDSSFHCLDAIGEAYFENDNLKSAFKYFNLAAEKADAEQLLYLASFAAEAGREKDLKRYLDKAKKLAPDNPLPYVIPLIFAFQDPLSLLLGIERMDEMMRDLDTAENLARAKPEFAQDLAVINELKDVFRNAPIPALFDDDDEDDDEDVSGLFPFRRLKPKRRR